MVVVCAERQYHFYGYNPIRGCAQTDAPGYWWTSARDEYTYEGQKLVSRTTRGYSENDTALRSASTFTYDGAGDLTGETRIDYQSNLTTTVSYDWNYEAGAQRLTQFTAANGVTTTLEYDGLGRLSHRTNAKGSSDYVYVGASDWLLKETWHSALGGQTFDLVQYDYLNGAPFRMKVATSDSNLTQLWSYNTYYLQYNWHGDKWTQ